MRPFFWNQRRKYGEALKAALLGARSPKLFNGIVVLYGMIDRTSSPIDLSLRSLVTVRVSQVNDCPFCVDMNSATLLRRGVSVEKVEALRMWRESPLFDGRDKAVLEFAEAMTAVCGMLVPALIYVAINAGDPTALRGWAIPAATDIAFALGVLALLGSRVPASLKVFLLAVAIIDDLGAIIVIAVFYTASLSFAALAAAAAGIFALAALNYAGILRIAAYILVGVFVWLFVLKSGVHATLAGVVVALAVPMTADQPDGETPLHRLEHMLHPWVAYGILPLFAFANAGVSLSGVTFGTLLQPIPLGILLGLVVGKTIGIAGGSWLAIRAGWCAKPEGANWQQMIGVAMLGGIGFTMSLFIGMLAFPDPSYATAIRLGVLIGSILAAVVGSVILIRGARTT